LFARDHRTYAPSVVRGGHQRWLTALALSSACGSAPAPGHEDEGTSGPGSSSGEATSLDTTGTATGEDTSSTGDSDIPEPWTVRVFSERATRIEAWVYDEPLDASPSVVLELEPVGDGHWEGTLDADVRHDAGLETLFYGFRAWGPNWPYDPLWEPGTEIGFVTDVDDHGNRFNPNKLLIDPYARELTHDPQTLEHHGHAVFASGPDRRQIDSGPRAPKSIALVDPSPLPPGPDRGLRDEIIYEVHVRGFTRSDPTVSEACRGTYAGAAQKASYLAELGFTAIELLPIHETDNDHNDREEGAEGDNYWGYSTLSYFAPDRRYACDKSPGGPRGSRSTWTWCTTIRARPAHGERWKRQRSSPGVGSTTRTTTS
jgi:isoamylase